MAVAEKETGNTVEMLWDPATQEVHGGQTWRSCGDSFVDDFSVTTNAFGAPEPAVAAAAAALSRIHHYPAADAGDALAAMARLTAFPASQMLLGNGASEFIDLVMRVGPAGAFKPGPYAAAYKEYDRAAIASGREVLAADSTAPAGVTVVIHPNSPTGDVMDLAALDALVDAAAGLVVVDESFIVFEGPTWRAASALNLIEKYPTKVVVLASWTKLWSCPGLRLGTIAASAGWTTTLKKMQTPWSCNSAAQAFAVAAAGDGDYLARTWATLPGWKRLTEERLRALGWAPNAASPAWVPWVYVDAGGEATARRAADVAQAAGVPVRWCASFGQPAFLRLGVRCPASQDVLFGAWAAAFGKAA
eukprot:TRINITY_DN5392_c0_g1_i5.p2 TRINITY_DN5392_c0_g1~~TRINITY_DN5392_c0_g1_i5.p2  ORF type:complete len:390 (-),score=148.97 TRINITY_DN5392_c0_g1_i5:177-1259(-)